MAIYYGGYDLGGKNVRAVIADERGEFICEPCQEEVDKSRGPGGVSCQMVRLMEALARKEGISLKNIVAYGVTAAGPLELRDPPILEEFGESIKDSTNIVFPDLDRPEYQKYVIEDIVYIPLGKPLKEGLNCELVKVINDVNGAVLGEFWDGVGKGYDDKSNLTIATITLGAGFGGGVCQNGVVLEGHYGNAAEVGHFLSGLSKGVACGCGKLDCAEAYVSGTGIAHNGVYTILTTPDGFDSPVYETAREVAWGKVPDEIDDKEAFLKENPYLVLDYITEEAERTRVLRENDFQSGSYQEARQRALSNLPGEIRDKERFLAEHPGFVLQQVNSEIICAQAKKFDPVALRVIMEAQIALGNVLHQMAKAYNPRYITYYGSVIVHNEDLLKEPAVRIMKRGLNVEAPCFVRSPIADDLGLHGGIRLAMQQYSR